MNTLERCPSCQSPLSPQTPVCDTCGRIFAIAASSALPPIVAPMLAPATPLQPGNVLAHGRYTIQRPLSRGGMGALYLATDHEAFERTVVIKALLDDSSPTQVQEIQAARARFEREARTLAALTYPTIPQIFSYFEQVGQTYIVMAYIDGHDLLQGLTRQDLNSQKLISGHAYPIGEVIHWGVALCRTLEYLASRTPPVLHLDIKPANLILSAQSNDLFLVDFGAARGRLLASSGGAAQTMAFGTPGYAAPEQYQGQSDLSSDIYALAATLYHLVTDDDPSAHPFTFPRLGYLGYLGAILRAALDPSPAKRPTAASLREQLEALLLPESRRILYAPDQQAIQNEHDLVHWCEQHWAEATEWLSHSLADQVQFNWVKLDLAAKLRACRQHNTNDANAALDAALALLDPAGFGADGAILTVDKASLDTKAFTLALNGDRATTQLTLRNAGRRYALVSMMLPFWMSTPTEKITLLPGQSASIALEIDPSKMPTAPRSPTVRIHNNAGADVVVPLQGEVPRIQPPPATSPKVVIFMLLVVFTLVFILPMLAALLQMLGV
ncbi:MAG TPA: protein kinase [Kouleothrix sp.]|nr:protein kinase [Kouleothrix sp.]